MRSTTASTTPCLLASISSGASTRGKRPDVRLPQRVVLPFGYRVTVKLVTDAEMLSHQDANDQDEAGDGLWQVGCRTIYIRKALPKPRQRYLLSHELGHAFLDWQHHYLGVTGTMKP